MRCNFLKFVTNFLKPILTSIRGPIDTIVLAVPRVVSRINNCKLSLCYDKRVKQSLTKCMRTFTFIQLQNLEYSVLKTFVMLRIMWFYNRKSLSKIPL